MRSVAKFVLAMVVTATLTACAAPGTAQRAQPPAPTQPQDPYLQMMGQLPEPRLSQAIAAAADQPLGSRDNPVRADRPSGQRAYLARLRCDDGQPPSFSRDGSFGPGPFGSIIDRYSVTCPGSTPARTQVFMDMYFPGYVETRPVAGFTTAP